MEEEDQQRVEVGTPTSTSFPMLLADRYVSHFEKGMSERLRLQEIATRLHNKSDMDIDPGATDLAENWLAGLLNGDQVIC